MKNRAERKEELLEQMRNPRQRDEVIAHLKGLLKLSGSRDLPRGTAIIDDILIQEYGETLLQKQLQRQKTVIRRVYRKPNAETEVTETA